MSLPVKPSVRPQPALGQAILKLRQKREMTQAELADKTGLSGRTLSAIESGQANPSWAAVCDLADALDVPIAEVAKLVEESPG